MLCDRIFFSLPGLTDSQIGSMLGIRRQSVQGWKTGKSRPTIPQIHTISQHTKISIRWFISGQTSDHLSISQAFYPKYYDKRSVIDLKAYNLAREVAAQALISANDRLFLPILSFLNNISYSSGKEDPDYPLINACSTIPQLLSRLPDTSKFKICSKTRRLYAEMNKSYIRLPYRLRLPPEYAPEPIGCVRAFTSLPSTATTNYPPQLQQFPETLSTEDNILICGDDLSPAVRHNQQIRISAPISFQSVSTQSQSLLLVHLQAGTEIKGINTVNNDFFLCRFGYNSGKSLILSDSKNQTAPYIISHTQIKDVYPVHSVLWD